MEEATVNHRNLGPAFWELAYAQFHLDFFVYHRLTSRSLTVDLELIELFVDIRRLFSDNITVVKQESGGWNRRTCSFLVLISSQVLEIRSTLMYHTTTLRFGCLLTATSWPWMTLNARFNLKCALQTARLAYIRMLRCYGSWPCDRPNE